MAGSLRPSAEDGQEFSLSSFSSKHLSSSTLVRTGLPWISACAGGATGTMAEELGIPWQTLKPTDIGDLVSFLNRPARPK
jgi:hypothetical protein